MGGEQRSTAIIIKAVHCDGRNTRKATDKVVTLSYHHAVLILSEPNHIHDSLHTHIRISTEEAG